MIAGKRWFLDGRRESAMRVSMLFLTLAIACTGCAGNGSSAGSDVAQSTDGAVDDDGRGNAETLDAETDADAIAECLTPCGVTFTVVNNAAFEEFIEGERPLRMYKKEGSDWVKFLPEHGCADVCAGCQAFSCSGCYGMKPVAAGASHAITWAGQMYGYEEDQECVTEGGESITCMVQTPAPAGRYKVELDYSWKWHEGTCQDDDYPYLSAPTTIAMEFDYPVADGNPLVLEIPADTTQVPPWPPGESLTVLDWKLPSPRAGVASAVEPSFRIWLAGGDTGTSTLAEVVRFDPDEGVKTDDDIQLPVPVKAACAVWVDDAGKMLVAGGMTSSGPTDAIQSCDHSGCEQLAESLPAALGLPACFSDGSQAYVMGGNGGAAGLSDVIYSVDPYSGSSTPEAVKLPTPRASRIGAVWSGEYAYFIGGLVQGGKTDEILRYEPWSDELETLEAKLPLALDGGTYAWMNDVIVVLGGETSTAPTDFVVLVDPESGTVTQSSLKLPAPRRGTAGGALGSAIYVFGGAGPTGLTDQIVRYVLK
jgi:hypothetical protein